MDLSVAYSKFPCSIVIDVPLPSYRLASTALRALQVDAELSPLVQRSFSLAERASSAAEGQKGCPARAAANGAAAAAEDHVDKEDKTVLRTEYRATTNRMLRVAVNGFMESLGVVLGVMEELDVDVLKASD